MGQDFRLQVWLNEREIKALKWMARREDRTVANLIRHMIAEKFRQVRSEEEAAAK